MLQAQQSITPVAHNPNSNSESCSGERNYQYPAAWKQTSMCIHLEKHCDPDTKSCRSTTPGQRAAAQNKTESCSLSKSRPGTVQCACWPATTARAAEKYRLQHQDVATVARTCCRAADPMRPIPRPRHNHHQERGTAAAMPFWRQQQSPATPPPFIETCPGGKRYQHEQLGRQLPAATTPAVCSNHWLDQPHPIPVIETNVCLPMHQAAKQQPRCTCLIPIIY
jgi:hypothetical protein